MGVVVVVGVQALAFAVCLSLGEAGGRLGSIGGAGGLWCALRVCLALGE